MIRFRLLKIPVTVGGSFLLMAGLLGFLGRREPIYVVAWVVIVFFSILIHEYGHALTARSMGATVQIELNGLGGLTRWSVPEESFGPGRRALVAASGSAVGVAFGGLVWLVATRFGPYTELVAFIINNLIWVNLFWGLLNWVPIRPLDGGHLLISLLQKIAPKRVDVIARVVFTITAASALIWAVMSDLLFIAVLAGWMLLVELVPRSQGGAPQASIPELSYDDAVGEEEAAPIPEFSFDDPVEGEEPAPPERGDVGHG